MWVTMMAEESTNRQFLRFAQYIQLASATSVPIPSRPVNTKEGGFEDISQQDQCESGTDSSVL